MVDPSSEMAELATELKAHAAWLRDSGADDLPPLGSLSKLKQPPNALATAKPLPIPAPAVPVSAPVAVTPPSPLAARSSILEVVPALPQIRQDLGNCTRCSLHKERTNIVFGVGNPKAEVVFVGEGPGADEDRTGEPFVGRAGQLLTKMIEAMGFQRSDVYICNVVKCRPPGNRVPEPEEMETCLPFLRAQLRAIGPKAIVVLGRTATLGLLNDRTPISQLRGHWLSYDGIPVMPTFHPAYLLRSPPEKVKAWNDLKAVVKHLGRTLPAR